MTWRWRRGAAERAKKQSRGDRGGLSVCVCVCVRMRVCVRLNEREGGGDSCISHKATTNLFEVRGITLCAAGECVCPCLCLLNCVYVFVCVCVCFSYVGRIWTCVSWGRSFSPTRTVWWRSSTLLPLAPMCPEWTKYYSRTRSCMKISEWQGCREGGGVGAYACRTLSWNPSLPPLFHFRNELTREVDQLLANNRNLEA